MTQRILTSAGRMKGGYVRQGTKAPRRIVSITYCDEEGQWHLVLTGALPPMVDFTVSSPNE
jgi:hypothetical protein